MSPGQFLVKKREVDGVTQRDISIRQRRAYEDGSSFGSIHAIESGKTQITKTNIEEIVIGYQLSPKEVSQLKALIVAEREAPLSRQEKELLRALLRLPKKSLHRVINIANRDSVIIK